MKNTLALVLGGGSGTRLYPLTKERSKPAVPIAGKYRLIDIPISNCINSDINRVFVLTQFLAISLNHHVASTYRFDNFRKQGFVNILSAERTAAKDNVDWYQGTADAVRKTLRHTKRYNFKEFLILSSDHIYRMDYKAMVRLHRSRGADVSVAAMEVARPRVPELGVMNINDDGRIKRFVEKPQETKVIDSLEIPAEYYKKHNEEVQKDMFFANMGVYVFNRDILIDMLTNTDAEDFGKQILPMTVESGLKVYSHKFDGYWKDVGTIKEFFDANIALTDPLPEFSFYGDENQIFTHARFLPASKLHDVKVEDSLLAEGCILAGSDIKKSVVGIRSIVRDGTTIRYSILMGADYYETDEEMKILSDKKKLGIGKNCVIRKAIIDKNARIGDNVVLVGGDKPDFESEAGWMLRDGILVVTKNTTIPDGTVIDFSK